MLVALQCLCSSGVLQPELGAVLRACHKAPVRVGALQWGSAPQGRVEPAEGLDQHSAGSSLGRELTLRAEASSFRAACAQCRPAGWLRPGGGAPSALCRGVELLLLPPALWPAGLLAHAAGTHHSPAQGLALSPRRGELGAPLPPATPGGHDPADSQP